MGDHFVHTKILLSREDKFSRGQVVHGKCHAGGNTTSRSNQNPILDACLYKVKFPGGEMTKLAVNIIEESMCAQCDVDRNEYLLAEVFASHRKNGSALTVED